MIQVPSFPLFFLFEAVTYLPNSPTESSGSLGNEAPWPRVKIAEMTALKG